MTPAEHVADGGLARLGEQVERFISEEGMQFNEVADRAGISVETLNKIRKGVKARPVTYRRLERALGWVSGSVDVVRAGGEPRLLPDSEGGVALAGPEAGAAPAVEEPVETTSPQAAAILTILEGLPVHVQAEVLRRLGDRLPEEVRRSM